MLEIGAAWIRMAVFFGGLAGFLFWEMKNPYREPSVSKTKRLAINLGMTALNNILLFFLYGGAVLAVSTYVTVNNIGLLNLLDLPAWVKIFITVAVLDFMLYVWHLLNHEMPTLWRFHRVHHTDLNMDVSTATRFHIGELAVSVLIKLALIYLLGASLAGVLIFETLVVLAAQFHHSSLRISPEFEKWYYILFVPPSMHRIHHSVKIKERNTNYGTIFSLWDRILGTMLTKVDQDRIRIGVGGHFDEKKLNLHHLLAMPATRNVR